MIYLAKTLKQIYNRKAHLQNCNKTTRTTKWNGAELGVHMETIAFTGNALTYVTEILDVLTLVCSSPFQVAEFALFHPWQHE